MGSSPTTLLAMVLAMVMTSSFGNAAPTSAPHDYDVRDIDTTIGSGAVVAAVGNAFAAVSSRDTEDKVSNDLKSRDLAQILAYASDSMQHGPNIELGVTGIIVDNNPKGLPLPTSPP